MRTLLALFFLLALSAGALAAEIRKGAAMQVKANSIWFQDKTQFARWQQLRKSGDTKALTSYETKLLSGRDAWQFTNPLNVKILKYEPRQNRVSVEMTTEGRMLGTTWELDLSALVP